MDKVLECDIAIDKLNSCGTPEGNGLKAVAKGCLAIAYAIKEVSELLKEIIEEAKRQKE